jgi:hypothetical protein
MQQIAAELGADLLPNAAIALDSREQRDRGRDDTYRSYLQMFAARGAEAVRAP